MLQTFELERHRCLKPEVTYRKRHRWCLSDIGRDTFGRFLYRGSELMRLQFHGPQRIT